MPAPSIVWFRNDLRLADNQALHAAAKRGSPVVPVFIWAPDEEGEWPLGAASRWWLHQSLAKLEAALVGRGIQLIIRPGPSATTLQNLVAEVRAGAVFWNRRYEPAILDRDRRIEEQLRERSCLVETFSSGFLFEPGSVLNKSKKPFQVFTAFWNTCLGLEPPAEPLAQPRGLEPTAASPKSLPLSALKLEPRINWTAGLAAAWEPGEAGAAKTLRDFCSSALPQYRQERDHPASRGTSRLSPHLHFGEVSPRQVWQAVRHLAEKMGFGQRSFQNSKFLAELGWREFAHHLLFHFPHTPLHPLRTEFERFPWRDDPVRLEAWQRGRTGYPLVDAGMRELWTTGWMHNRVRMVVASFLIKDLLLPWQAGAKWFWDTLVDADLANNTLGWQWTAGSGADSAPFFRIFNPVSQGEKFDPQGEYVRRWVPEIARLPDPWIHRPWQAPPEVLKQAGIQLDVNYPLPIVDPAEARRLALAAFERIKSKPGSLVFG
jgi:deoxyribodipyrimidine photo-lyase